MSKPLRVLIVEDSEDDALLTIHELKRGGYETTFERVETAEAMTAALEKQAWDIIIADYSLPHFSAPEALELFRQSGFDLPFIVISGTVGEETAVTTMKAGAHDYLMKGNLTRLVPAIERELHETEVRKERNQAEESLRQSEEKLRLMFESVADSITVSDLNGVITNANERTVEMLRLGSKEKLLGKALFEFIPQRYHSEVMTVMQQGLIEGTINAMENILTRPDGTEFPGEISVSILKNATGDPTGFITVIKDITERKKMEEQLIITDRLASIGELSAGIAHELNNPLTGVIGLSQLLVERDLPEDVKEDIKLVYSEAQRAAGVVRNMLTFAREHPPAKALLSIHDVISKVLELRAYEQRVSNIEVVRHFAPDLPQIMGDYFQLQQVFLNIVINAEQIMTEVHGKGTLIITTQTTGDIVTVSFADDGPGIPKENLGHIFDPFFTTKEVGKGTGLGLSICHGIISAHSGRIYAESEPGKGATFIVELPLRQEEKQGEEL